MKTRTFARSVIAANEIIELVSSSSSRTLIIACISGGGSALFCSPREGLTLERSGFSVQF